MLKNKKIKYYEKHCALLEEELNEIKKKNTMLETELLIYKNGDNESSNRLKKLIEEVFTAKKMYEDLNNELKEKISTSNDMLREIKKIKTKYVKLEKE